LLASAEGLFAAIREGVIKSTIFKTFQLSEVAEIHRFMEGRKTIGSIVLVP
jgi:NADPH2:quinone reductase